MESGENTAIRQKEFCRQEGPWRSFFSAEAGKDFAWFFLIGGEGVLIFGKAFF